MAGLGQDMKYRWARFSVLEKMIGINVGLFVIPGILAAILSLFKKELTSLFSWVELYPDISQLIFKPWTLLTYGFFHTGLWHLFWNMFILYFAGKIFMNLFNGRRFLNVYLLGIIAGGLVFLLSYNIFPTFDGRFAPLIGASAGVMAILIFVCAYIPNQEVRVIFFNAKLWQVGLFFVIVDLLQLNSANAGGHLAHLGGALLGFFYARQLLKGKDIGEWFGKWMDGISNLFKSKPRTKSKLKTVYKKQPDTKKGAAGMSKDAQQQKIDDILDKISKSGYDSLTKAEKDFLFRAGKDQ